VLKGATFYLGKKGAAFAGGITREKRSQLALCGTASISQGAPGIELRSEKGEVIEEQPGKRR